VYGGTFEPSFSRSVVLAKLLRRNDLNRGHTFV
jgi:hypothetical protein